MVLSPNPGAHVLMSSGVLGQFMNTIATHIVQHVTILNIQALLRYLQSVDRHGCHTVKLFTQILQHMSVCIHGVSVEKPGIVGIVDTF